MVNKSLVSNAPPAFNLKPRKILVRGVNWLGDAVMTTPALQRLREAKPDAHITLLTHHKLADLWHNQPAIDSVITFSPGDSVWVTGKRLREKRFDLGLAFPNSHRAALELFLARIPERIGYRRPFRNLFLTKTVAPREAAFEMRKRSLPEIKRLITNPVAFPPLPRNAHHIFQYLHLVAAVGASSESVAPNLRVSSDDISAFQKSLAVLVGSTSGVWLGLNPGAEYGPAKRWPKERFVDAAVELHQRTGCRWILFGVNEPETNWIARELVLRSGNNVVVNFAGKTTLRQLCAGLKFCRALLTNDTGPMHVGAALGIPVVVPFGSTSIELTGPGLPCDQTHALLSASAPCSPCFLPECPIDFRCMTSISVQSVVSAILRILQ